MPDILTSFNQNGSPLSNLNGAQGPDYNQTNFKQSKLHDTYSVNNIPSLLGQPNPSVLDLDAEIPANNYRDNAPPGAQQF
tara:strand:- start:1652 stop:1891 length:240 start_codon:yes stop_codon:yes gene_type:complete